MSLIHKVFAQAADNPIPTIVGVVKNPLPVGYQSLAGLITFLSNILRLVIVAAGIYALFNFIVAGYQYMTAAGDSKTLEKAWARIWQTLLGLVIIVGSFAFAALLGYLIMNDASYFLNPRIYGPETTTAPAQIPGFTP